MCNKGRMERAAPTDDRQDQDPVRRLAAFRQRFPAQTLQLGGVRWRYHELGAGPALVFLHGLVGSGEVWFQQLLAFAGAYRVLAPTLPPYGSLDELTVGVWRWLDRLGVERLQLVGASLGGLVAQHMVATQPERIERVVFSNTFPPGHPEIVRGRWRLVLGRVLPSPLLFAYLRRSLRRVAGVEPGERLLRAYLHEQYHGGLSRTELLARLACVYDDVEIAPIRMPHAIIESLDDPLMSRALRADLKRLYPRAWVYTFKRGGHFPYLTQPKEYNQALVAFLGASYA